jgi:glycosyltransferase involved in cell wall biosynthesis
LITGIRDKLLYYLGVKLADGIIAQNHHQQELCENNFHKQAKVISMVIDTNNLGKISSGEKVIWTGPLRKVKRPELFLQLAKRFPETEFVLIGGGIETEAAFADQIREQAEEIPNLTCTGRIPHADVVQQFQEAAVLVNTSIVEGFPNAYLEAWKSGVSVVSFDDVDGYIEEEGIGAVCSDLENMEERLRSILEDPALRISMGKRARDFVLSKFSASVLSNEYLSFFEELLNKRFHRAGC